MDLIANSVIWPSEKFYLYLGFCCVISCTGQEAILPPRLHSLLTPQSGFVQTGFWETSADDGTICVRWLCAGRNISRLASSPAAAALASGAGECCESRPTCFLALLPATARARSALSR